MKDTTWSRGTKFAHQVNVLERHAGRLVQEEPDDDRAEEVARGEHEAVAELDGGDDERREEREEEVLIPATLGYIMNVIKIQEKNWCLPRASLRRLRSRLAWRACVFGMSLR